jgi:integrator complex subunit 1
LVHSKEPAEADEQKIRDAATIANAYRNFEHTTHDEEEDADPKSFSSLQHRGSMSSTGSANLHRSTSLDSQGDNYGTNEQAYGDDSNSGDEEEHVLDSAVRNNTKRDDTDGDDSSSGEEDEEVVVTNKSNGKVSMNAVPESQGSEVSLSTSTNGVDAMQLSPKASNLYQITQSNLDVTRVRQRFFDQNLFYAYDLISSSLLERLDVKSKQNSGLLQSLPAFTPIPGVRFLIASSLEKWLQSPALAGLARFLFSSTVNQMKNVDPPLEEDLKTIDAVLAMKLKANQVSPAISLRFCCCP